MYMQYLRHTEIIYCLSKIQSLLRNLCLSGNCILQSYEIHGTDLIKPTFNDRESLDNCTKFD